MSACDGQRVRVSSDPVDATNNESVSVDRAADAWDNDEEPSLDSPSFTPERLLLDREKFVKEFSLNDSVEHRKSLSDFLLGTISWEDCKEEILTGWFAEAFGDEQRMHLLKEFGKSIVRPFRVPSPEDFVFIDKISNRDPMVIDVLIAVVIEEELRESVYIQRAKSGNDLDRLLRAMSEGKNPIYKRLAEELAPRLYGVPPEVR